MHRSAILVNVCAAGLVAENEQLSSQFAEHTWRRFVSGAMPAIHHDAQALQREPARNRGFRKFDIAAQCVINTHRFADFACAGDDGSDLATED